MCRNPQLMQQMLLEADAIFINGGDQSLTMRSLQKKPGEFTEVSQLLHQRIDAGVPLAGSSAGTAVQAGYTKKKIPMISGGQTVKALQYGAYATEPNAPLCHYHQSCSSDLDGSWLTLQSGWWPAVFYFRCHRHAFSRAQPRRQVITFTHRYQYRLWFWYG